MAAVSLARGHFSDGAEEAMMAQMIDALKAAVEAEKAELLAELSQAAEPRRSVIRREIAACDSLLTRLIRFEPPDIHLTNPAT
jgi:hypothetical protein